jgi:hypothetical protein
VTLGLLACRGEGARSAPLPIPGEQGVRTTVEVLNASGKPGLAKTATRMLRRAGIDVLTFRTAPDTLGPLDSTRIVVRRGDLAAGERVRRALGVGRVTAAPDARKLLDASVFLGTDFAPRVPFHP